MSRPPLLPPALVERAARPYRTAGLHPWFFARGKLGHDPVFAGLLRLGLIPHGARLLDLGCGQGLLAALLLAAEAPARDIGWPAHWAEAPRGVTVRGIDFVARDVRRAQCAVMAAGADTARARFEHADIRNADFGAADVVLLLDVLHYLDWGSQRQVLERARNCLAPAGTLLLRVADANAGLSFRFGRFVDKAVLVGRGLRGTQLCCRPLTEWQRLLETIGFSVRTLPMHAGTPFANLLLVCRIGTAPPHQSELPAPAAPMGQTSNDCYL